MTGHGGWPLTVFLDPERRARSTAAPTSRPSRARACRASAMVLEAVVERLDEPARGDPRSARRGSRERLGAIGAASSRPSEPLDAEPARRRGRGAARSGRPRATAASAARRSSRPRSALEFLLAPRRAPTIGRADARRDGARRHLRPARRRLRPLLGRRAWLVPHFEKMLYDNALLARAYLHGWQVLGHERCRARLRGDARLGAARDARARGRLLLGARRRLRGRGGQVLRLDAGRDARRRSATRAATPTSDRATSASAERGNFEGATSSTCRGGAAAEPPDRLDEARRGALRAPRAKRVWPGLDDKRLTSWNALMIAALAEAGAVLGRDDYLDAAARLRRVRARRRCATPTAACCAPTRTARRSSTPTSRTTPSCSRRC